VPIRNGASPVASALSIRSGATPRGPIHTITPLPNQPSQPDISTLLGLGRFYFAATGSESDRLRIDRLRIDGISALLKATGGQSAAQTGPLLVSIDIRLNVSDDSVFHLGDEGEEHGTFAAQAID